MANPTPLGSEQKAWSNQPTPSLASHPQEWPEPWHELYEERAAILEFDAGYSREAAEELAALEIRERFDAAVREKHG